MAHVKMAIGIGRAIMENIESRVEKGKSESITVYRLLREVRHL